MSALGKLAIYGLAALIAIVMAAKAHDQPFAIQMVIFAIAALIAPGGDGQAGGLRRDPTR